MVGWFQLWPDRSAAGLLFVSALWVCSRGHIGASATLGALHHSKRTARQNRQGDAQDRTRSRDGAEFPGWSQDLPRKLRGLPWVARAAEVRKREGHVSSTSTFV